LDWESNPGTGEVDADALAQAFSLGPVAMMFSNPNNPTGAVLSTATLELVAELAAKQRALVIADELYSRLIFDDRPFVHFATMESVSDLFVTTIGPSKTESMSGYRIGVTVGPPWLIDRVEDIMSSSVLRAPAYAQHILVKWAASDSEFVRERVSKYQALRDIAVERLNVRGVMSVTRSAGTSYLFPRVLGGNLGDQEVALVLKQRAGVLINPGYQFGDRGVGSFRLCIAQDQHVLETCLEAMVEVLAGKTQA
jgi:aspartate/methionine/tyrosine aminotransferase